VVNLLGEEVYTEELVDFEGQHQTACRHEWQTKRGVLLRNYHTKRKYQSKDSASIIFLNRKNIKSPEQMLGAFY
jgi:hypothetical protein